MCGSSICWCRSNCTPMELICRSSKGSAREQWAFICAINWSATRCLPKSPIVVNSGENLSAASSDHPLCHRDFHDAVIVGCPGKSLIGKSFGEVTEECGLHPLDAFLDVFVENGECNVPVDDHRRPLPA